MSDAGLLAPYRTWLEGYPELRWRGRVTQVIGPLVESEGPFCSVGEVCEIIDSRGHVLPGQVVGFRGTTVLSMPLESPRRGAAWGCGMYPGSAAHDSAGR